MVYTQSGSAEMRDRLEAIRIRKKKQVEPIRYWISIYIVKTALLILDVFSLIRMSYQSIRLTFSKSFYKSSLQQIDQNCLRMKGEYDDFEDDDECQYVGLGARKKNKISQNQQIYGDFYQAYEQQPKPSAPKLNPSFKNAYNRFKPGSVIENYAAECDVHIPEPKKKVKLDQEPEQIEQPEIGHFNLQSFLRDFQQKQNLQSIQEEEQEEQQNGPICLNTKVKNTLKLLKIGQEDEQDIDQNQLNPDQMTFEQYRKLVMRNGKKNDLKPHKKLTPKEKQKQKEFITSYGKGYSMLEKMGFNLTKGLGKHEKGITAPVEAVFKTAFTTKDSEFLEEDSKEEELETQDEEIPAEIALFQFRSRNPKVNNFLLDLKNKFESVGAKMNFYQRDLQQIDRDAEISCSLKLQKKNELDEHDEEINKLKNVKEVCKGRYAISTNPSHNQQVNLKHAHLALNYKLDLLQVKTAYTHLQSLTPQSLFVTFPTLIRRLQKSLMNFYIEKQRETLKNYRQGVKSLRDLRKVVNLEEEVVDLVQETQLEREVIVSIEDQLRVRRMVELVAENTLMVKAGQVFEQYRKIEDVQDFQLLKSLRALKQLHPHSSIVKTFINQKIKPLVLSYYNSFDYQEVPPLNKVYKYYKDGQKASDNAGPLPHMVLFPLFQIMDPAELQFGKLLKTLSKKLWNLTTPTLFSILKPILQYCPVAQRQHFLNFYLTPRLLDYLEEFELTQPHICKKLMTMLKLHKELLEIDSLKDLLNCTIVPEIVMTYRKYESEGTGKQELREWAERWTKEIGKVVPNYLEEMLANDFNIQV